MAVVLGVYHAVLDLADAFFSIPLATGSQDQRVLTWKTFQVLPQGYLQGPTCHGMIAGELSLTSFPTSVKWAHQLH